MGIHDLTFYDIINRNATTFGNRSAWYEVDDGRTLTFREIKEQVDCLAAGLKTIGLEKQDRIGVYGKNSLEYFLIYGAAAALGAVVLPINWRLSPEEAAFNLNDGTPKILFVDPEFEEPFRENNPDRFPSIGAVYNLRPGGAFAGIRSLMSDPSDFKETEATFDDGFVIIHTAAVAGRPRGAILSHGNVLCADIHLNLCFGLSFSDVHLNLLPLFHVGGLFMATNTFHAGALNVNMSKFDAAKAVSLIEEKGVTVFFEFPPILSSILEAHRETKKEIRSVRAVLGLGVPETIQAFQNITGGTFYCMYGQTETSCLATLGRWDDRPGSAGKIIPLSDVRLVDDNDRPVPTGQIGEIVMKGPMVFKGFWGLEEDTAYTFRGGWHHTGDLGRFDEDGFLFYAGRKAEKELIKPGGENVYPAEVEKAILEHPDVEAAVVFGVPDPKWKEGIKAVCRLKAGSELDPKDLIRFVGERIASYKKPQYVQFVAEIPVKADGSPDRARIKELYGGLQ
ncbi:MAG: AMP-binding protein [Deltaproteobacteria bacterium]|nr:AMP-binding protein [Deltaproteobacteria bacterium]